MNKVLLGWVVYQWFQWWCMTVRWWTVTASGRAQLWVCSALSCRWWWSSDKCGVGQLWWFVVALVAVEAFLPHEGDCGCLFYLRPWLWSIFNCRFSKVRHAFAETRSRLRLKKEQGSDFGRSIVKVTCWQRWRWSWVAWLFQIWVFFLGLLRSSVGVTIVVDSSDLCCSVK